MILQKLKILPFVLFLVGASLLAAATVVKAEVYDNADDYCVASGLNPGMGSQYTDCVNRVNDDYLACSDAYGTGNDRWNDCTQNVLTYPPVTEENGGGNTGLTSIGDEYTVDVPQYADDQNPIYLRLNEIIDFLSIGIGIVITGSVIFAGIQWAASRGDPQAAGKAISRLVNTGIALLLYVFGWALLNWLVPGGIFN